MKTVTALLAALSFFGLGGISVFAAEFRGRIPRTQC
jgi:hypothetical protein